MSTKVCNFQAYTAEGNDDGQHQVFGALIENQDTELLETQGMNPNDPPIGPKSVPLMEFALATPSNKRSRVSKLSTVDSAIKKLQAIAENKPSFSKTAKNEADEFELFGQHIAAQMRKLPARSFVILQEKFQSLITKERLKYMTAESPMSSGSPYSASSFVSDEEEVSTRVKQDLFHVDNLLYKNLN